MSENNDDKTPVKPGWKTTEFWISLIAVLAGSLAASGVVPADSVWERIVGLIIAAFAALGYTGARLTIKRAES